MNDSLNSAPALALIAAGYTLRMDYMIERRGWLCDAFKEKTGIACAQFIAIEDVESTEYDGNPWTLIRRSLDEHSRESELEVLKKMDFGAGA